MELAFLNIHLFFRVSENHYLANLLSTPSGKSYRIFFTLYVYIYHEHNFLNCGLCPMIGIHENEVGESESCVMDHHNKTLHLIHCSFEENFCVIKISANLSFFKFLPKSSIGRARISNALICLSCNILKFLVFFIILYL